MYAYLLVWWKKWEGIFSDCLSFICLLNICYLFLLIYQLIYLLPYLRVSFSVVKANTEEMEKALHLLFKTFLFFVFFFVLRIISYDENSARKNKNINFSAHVILAKSDPSNHRCRIRAVIVVARAINNV